MKNYSVKQSIVTRITEFRGDGAHHDRVMARRSLGVVLIVALLGWTVNQSIMGCEGQHSRAAVTVLAGASPAYQPEPSPTRHSCCPRESQTAAQPSSHPRKCHPRSSSSNDCCSVKKESSRALLPAILNEPASAKMLLGSAAPFLFALPTLQWAVSNGGQNALGGNVPSFAVLRL